MPTMTERVNALLAELLGGSCPAVLFDAMRHAVLVGGKRIRPQLCMAAAEAVGGRMEDAIYPACAIELLHSYTLVHDDLPAMDNDAVRRGAPSVWAKYGEANAILAGDALQALAFRTAVRAPRNAERIAAAIAEAGVGVVQGQVADLAGGDADFILRHKTADLFVAAAEMGALAGGGNDDDVARLREYALSIGIAFQLEDDLLDGDSPNPAGDARRAIDELTAAAVAALDGLPGDVAPLVAMAERLAERKS